MEIFEKILMVGERTPKINIICDLLCEADKVRFRSDADKGLHTVFLRHYDGVASMKHIDKDTVRIQSIFIPFGTEIVIPFQSVNWSGSDYNQIVFIQPYPFTTADITFELSKIPRCLDDGKALRIVTYKIMFYLDNHQHSGSGDLDKIDDVLKKAPDKLNKIIQKENDGSIIKSLINDQYSVYCIPSNLADVFHRRTNVLKAVSHISKKRFHEWQKSLLFFTAPDGPYSWIASHDENIKKLISSDYLDIFTNFKRIKGSSNVVKKYIELYCAQNEKAICDFAGNVYQSMIRKVCFWDLNKDVELLKRNVSVLIREKLDDGSSLICPKTKSEYDTRFIIYTHCDTKFKDSAIRLVEKDLMNYLFEYLKGKEKILSELFGNNE